MKRDSLDALVLSQIEDEKVGRWQRADDEEAGRWQLGPLVVAGTLVVAGAAGLGWTSRTRSPEAPGTPADTEISALVTQYQDSSREVGAPEQTAPGAHARESVNPWKAEDGPATRPATSPVESVAVPAATAPTRDAAEATEKPLPPGLDGKFYLQAGSFEVRETAERTAEHLRAQGFQAFATNYGGPKAGWWHVVRIGPFDSRVAAERSRLELGITTRNDAYVLPRSNGAHHVQVASLHDPQEAARLATRLQRQGHRARVVTLGPEGPEQWHCVRVGPFDDRAEAEAYRGLMAEHQIEGQVIPFVGE